MSDLEPIQKVTALITRDTPQGRQLLLFYRPDDRMTQLPAGTVEDGEAIEVALLREVAEETGLTAVRIVRKLAARWQPLAPDARVLLENHRLFDAPAGDSPGDLLLHRGMIVYLREAQGDWTRALYRAWEYDPETKRIAINWEREGWLPSAILTDRALRHFYHLTPTEPTAERWIVHDVASNGRALELHWVLLHGESGLLPLQESWVAPYREALSEAIST